MKPVQISPELIKRLRKLESSKIALNQMMQMLSRQAEQRVFNYNEDAKKVWGDIVKETGIDLGNVIWDLHPTENKVVPVQINLRGKALSTEVIEVD